MKASVKFLEEKFDEFNNLCFAGELPPVPIKLSNSRTFLGKLVYQKVRGPFGIVCGTSNFVIRISKLFDLPQNELEDVLIHEMIHYYIAFNRKRDKTAHGPLFRKIMSDINNLHNRHVTVSHKSVPGLESPLRHGNKPVYVCISDLGEKDLGITVCSSEMQSKISRSLKRYYRSLSGEIWYFGYNEYIDRYPRCRTPKIYKLDRKDLHVCISGLRQVGG